jgi:hypothetical protein
LRGARLVAAQEVDKGRHWADAKIKALTGGEHGPEANGVVMKTLRESGYRALETLRSGGDRCRRQRT